MKLITYLRVVGEAGAPVLSSLPEEQPRLEVVAAGRGPRRGQGAGCIGRGEAVEQTHGPHVVGRRREGEGGRARLWDPALEDNVDWLRSQRRLTTE